ncbi:MAG: hypothetical protein Ct9H300mP28_29330 [Pseudomonadota bacterium]|nr:MAG: hypothetical protein Ct9H300mP28_29330 [Pseudomonadota bacterium]
MPLLRQRCPTNAFKFEEENNSLHFKHINCVGCGLCEQYVLKKLSPSRENCILKKSHWTIEKSQKMRWLPAFNEKTLHKPQGIGGIEQGIRS